MWLQVCRQLASEAPNLNLAFYEAAVPTRLFPVLLMIIRQHPPTSPAPAAAAAALGALHSRGAALSRTWAREVRRKDGKDLLATLAASVGSRTKRAAPLRYEAARALIELIRTASDQDAAATLCLSRCCALLKRSDLEAEIVAVLALLSILCTGKPGAQWQVACSGVLPRLQQLMRHPESTVAAHAVRPIPIISFFFLRYHALALPLPDACLGVWSCVCAGGRAPEVETQVRGCRRSSWCTWQATTTTTPRCSACPCWRISSPT